MRVESSDQFSWECPRAREIWSISELLLVKDDLHFHSFMDYAVVEAHWDQYYIEKIIMVSWAM